MSSRVGIGERGLIYAASLYDARMWLDEAFCTCEAKAGHVNVAELAMHVESLRTPPSDHQRKI